MKYSSQKSYFSVFKHFINIKIKMSSNRNSLVTIHLFIYSVSIIIHLVSGHLRELTCYNYNEELFKQDPNTLKTDRINCYTGGSNKPSLLDCEKSNGQLCRQNRRVDWNWFDSTLKRLKINVMVLGKSFLVLTLSYVLIKLTWIYIVSDNRFFGFGIIFFIISENYKYFSFGFSVMQLFLQSKDELEIMEKMNNIA